MGNVFSCFESGHWDPHPQVTAVYTPAKTDVYQDMKQPLSHYFVSSGHNSYLTGNQLTSASGTATIIACLQQSCRVIELDVYNGPECKHGGTLTKAISFKECIEAIAEYAFKSSPYPVIITMENHANTENQGKMAEILRVVLGDLLFIPDPNDPMDAWKSPEELKHKVVCRTSLKANAHEEFKKLIYIKNSKFTSLADMIKKDKVVSSSFEEMSLPKVKELGADDEDEEKETKREMEKLTAQQAKAKAAGEATNSADETPEDAVVGGEMVTGSMQELYTYTGKHLMRVYPAGWRITSGNYNPMTAWIRGASFAALNWQVWDKPLWCNAGKFLDNGRCGYVLKPDWMRSPPTELPARLGRKLLVHVYSAHMHQGKNVSVFKDDLFVKMEVYGMPTDRESKYTHTVNNSGRLHVDKAFDFVVRFPEMAVLCVQLMDEDAGGAKTNHADADTLGYFTMPLSTLKPGDYKLQLCHPDSGKLLPADQAWIKVNLKWADDNPMYAGPQ
ncbi:hypothetical protein HYH02_008836 [Chlamydomonas schloesseri]|uniref:Phosphoinositide phospholipase C n=1 Tax=Chlamydomonas schloesseri TaxID=2026947 RepID=A0A836B225_9CHLO|nr:hypothetical protein HYH02_008836 [Chlamydomonas schloesseri]|eukprot:KAG2445371.1 hypothetical protein HYH02_008836 [Chlamydomonas schloesseri]